MRLLSFYRWVGDNKKTITSYKNIQNYKTKAFFPVEKGSVDPQFQQNETDLKPTSLVSCFRPDQHGSKPNVILVFIDDMGWGDFSCFGNEAAQTPKLDRLAKEGIRFEQFYVNSPICSPSRTAISTGQYPQRWKITSYLSNRDHNKQRGMAQWLDPKAPMLARSLQKAGYATGHFGKWHMGGQRNVADAPAITEYGFDQSLTNFEGMGPKLLPLTLKPGQDPDKPGRIWADAVRLGKGCVGCSDRRSRKALWKKRSPSSKGPSEEKPFTSTFGRTTCTVRFGLHCKMGRRFETQALSFRVGGHGRATWKVIRLRSERPETR